MRLRVTKEIGYGVFAAVGKTAGELSALAIGTTKAVPASL
jgi:hypothetical protein